MLPGFFALSAAFALLDAKTSHYYSCEFDHVDVSKRCFLWKEDPWKPSSKDCRPWRLSKCRHAIVRADFIKDCPVTLCHQVIRSPPASRALFFLFPAPGCRSLAGHLNQQQVRETGSIGDRKAASAPRKRKKALC